MRLAHVFLFIIMWFYSSTPKSALILRTGTRDQIWFQAENNAGIAPLEGPSPNRKVAWELEMSIHLHSLKGDLHSLSVQMEGLSREKVIAL